jgi:O-antigen/teichoic acid export membrane protein
LLVFRSVASTWVLNVLQALALLALAPFVIARLGDGQNGLWVAIVSLTGIASLFVLGVPIASVRFVAAAVARGDKAGADKAVSTCLGICIGLGAAALVALGVSYFVFERSYLGGEFAQGLDSYALEGGRIAFAVVAVQLAASFALRLPYGLLDAHQDFLARNAVMAGEVVLRLVLTFAMLAWSPTLPALACVQVVCALAEFAAARLVLRRRHPDVHFSLAAFDRSLVREILGFSVWALLLNVGALLAFRVDVLVIGAYLPAEAATQFDVGNKFFEPLTGLMVAVSAVVMPKSAALAATARRAELRDVFLRWSKICLSLVLLVGLYLLVLGPAFLGAWVGERFEATSGPVLRVLMASFVLWLPVRGVAIAILFGMGKPRAAALSFLALGVVNLALSVALVESHGILGVALGTAIPNVVFALHVLWLVCRELQLPIGEWIRYVVGRTALAALIPFAFLVLVQQTLDPRSLPALVATGAMSVAVFALAWVFVAYRGDRYIDARAVLARWFARGEGRAP